MSKAWNTGSTQAWRRTTKQVLERDQHRCQLRHEHCTGTATEVHHLDGKANGNNPDRCIATCHRCHATETRKQTIAAATIRPRATRAPERHPGIR